jgi:hypothetical protein
MRSSIVQGFGVGILGLCLTLASSGACLAQQCVGDCNGDGRVTVDEILRGVCWAICTQELRPPPCPALDPDNVGEITITNLIKAVNNALNGCPGGTPQPSVTPSVTATPIASAMATLMPTVSPTACSTPVCPGSILPPVCFDFEDPCYCYCEATPALSRTPSSTPTPTGPPPSPTPTGVCGEVCDNRPCGEFTCPGSNGLPTTRFCDVTYLGTGCQCSPIECPTAPPTPRAPSPTPSTPIPVKATCVPTPGGIPPYCAAHCEPCPTIRAGCNAQSCVRCIENPVCGLGEICAPQGAADLGCCACATVTPSVSM